MFKLKYNALSLVQIFFGLLNSLLLLKVFGVSVQTDAYFIGDVVVGGVVLLQMMAVEQFMYFYNDLKTTDPKNSGALFGYALFLALSTGVVSMALMNLLSVPIIKIFAYKLDPERAAILARLFPVFSLLVVLNPVSSLNTRLLNAEGRFGYPYLLGIIPSFFTVAAMLVMHSIGCGDIIWLLAASVSGIAVSAVLGLAAVRACGVPLRPKVSHPVGWDFVLNSIKVRFGHNINNMLVPLVTNNLLSSFPAGAVSHFGYAWKIVTVMGNLTTGPSARMFSTSVSKAWPRRDAAGIRALVREFLTLITPLFSASTAAAYLLLPAALGLLSSSRFSGSDMAGIRLMFLALSAWYLLGLVEAAFLQVCVASRRSRIFMINNTVFIAVYVFAAAVSRGYGGVYSIPVSLAAAQAVSLALYLRAYRGLISAL